MADPQPRPAHRRLTLPASEHRFSAGPAAGDVTGLLLRPEGARALYVFAHGAGAGMRHAFMEAAAQRLAAHRIASLRYQFPYVERGRKSPDRPPVLVGTVRAAVAEAARLASGMPLFAGGKSMGGRMTSTAAAERPLDGVRGLVFFGFPLHPAGRPGTERGAHLAEVGLPMLFLQGTRDSLADLELLRPLLGRVRLRPTLHVIEDADHGFHVRKRSGRTDEDVLEEMCATAAAWCLSLAEGA